MNQQTPPCAPAVAGQIGNSLMQMQARLAFERRRSQDLEADLLETQVELLQARADMEGLQAAERRVRHLAMHDSLTTLPNRSFFAERLDQALSAAAPQQRGFAVLYLDLDDFKQVNDTHGHAVGDELLRVVAARLSRSVRAEDVVSRLGGDEFACLLGDLPAREQLSHLACKVLDAVAAPCQIGELRLNIRPSIGIAMCPTDGETAELLIEHADAAMYNAKRHRSGYAFFDEQAARWAGETGFAPVAHPAQARASA